jgi:putative hydrolase of the HAD superfamily
MRAVHIPLSSIPPAQAGHTDGTPDAVVHALAEIPEVLGTL